MQLDTGEPTPADMRMSQYDSPTIKIYAQSDQPLAENECINIDYIVKRDDENSQPYSQPYIVPEDKSLVGFYFSQPIDGLWSADPMERLAAVSRLVNGFAFYEEPSCAGGMYVFKVKDQFNALQAGAPLMSGQYFGNEAKHFKSWRPVWTRTVGDPAAKPLAKIKYSGKQDRFYIPEGATNVQDASNPSLGLNTAQQEPINLAQTLLSQGDDRTNAGYAGNSLQGGPWQPRGPMNNRRGNQLDPEAQVQDPETLAQILARLLQGNDKVKPKTAGGEPEGGGGRKQRSKMKKNQPPAQQSEPEVARPKKISKAPVRGKKSSDKPDDPRDNLDLSSFNTDYKGRPPKVGDITYFDPSSAPTFQQSEQNEPSAFNTINQPDNDAREALLDRSIQSAPVRGNNTLSMLELKYANARLKSRN